MKNIVGTVIRRAAGVYLDAQFITIQIPGVFVNYPKKININLIIFHQTQIPDFL